LITQWVYLSSILDISDCIYTEIIPDYAWAVRGFWSAILPLLLRANWQLGAAWV